MFGLFKKKSKSEKLAEKYKKLMQEWHDLSSVNRSASDAKFAEAQDIEKQINQLNNETS